MPPSVLILSSPKDEHSKVVCQRLTQMKVPFKFWHKNLLFSQDNLIAKIQNDNFSFESKAEDGSVLDFRSFASVWHRRLGKIKVAKPFPAEWIDRMVERESDRGVDALLRSLDCFMVNDPARQEECLYKIWQLKMAKASGFLIPDTLLTSSPEEALSFIDSHNGNCIYKLIDELSAREVPMLERSGALATSAIRAEDRAHLNQISGSLHLLQENIAKACDIRLTVVGQKLFAAEIHSQAGVGQTDFRLDPKAQTKKHSLPDDLSAKCLDFMKKMRLSFACLDFALTKNGQYVFFEANPAGQFLWIEEATALPISQELAQLLVSGH